VTPPSGPWQWERDFVPLAQKLTVRNASGRVTQWVFMCDWENEYLQFIYQWGGRMYTPDGTRCTLDSPQCIAAITFCRDEGRMLPLWIQYYGGQLGIENLYVVDDNSEDGSTDDLPCDVLHIPPIRGGKFNSTRMAMVGNLGRSLLELYDVVLFCDTDEFIVPDPDRHAGLKKYVETRSGDGLNAVGSLGFNVVHDVGSEPPLDLDKPLLGQRRLAKFLPLLPRRRAVSA